MKLRILGAAVLALALAVPAQADTITLSPGTAPCGSPACLVASGDDTSQNDIDTIIAAFLGSAYEVYKDNVGGLEVGWLSGSYTTTYQVNYLALANAVISYDGGPTPSVPLFALIKDGNVTQPEPEAFDSWYLFNISNWDGVSDLQFEGFYGGNQGRISHIALYGTTSVPDGGSVVMLLGAALMGLAGFRRFVK